MGVSVGVSVGGVRGVSVRTSRKAAGGSAADSAAGARPAAALSASAAAICLMAHRFPPDRGAIAGHIRRLVSARDAAVLALRRPAAMPTSALLCAAVRSCAQLCAAVQLVRSCAACADPMPHASRWSIY